MIIVFNKNNKNCEKIVKTEKIIFQNFDHFLKKIWKFFQHFGHFLQYFDHFFKIQKT